MKIKGQCSCGAVTCEVDGDSVAQVYCHCHSCQKAHSAPVMAVALFPAGAVTLSGKTTTNSVTKRPHAARRISCAGCGTRVAVIPSGEGSDQMRGIFPAHFDSPDWFKPAMHIYWAERSIDINDKLPKYLDTPAAFGGSDKTA